MSGEVSCLKQTRLSFE